MSITLTTGKNVVINGVTQENDTIGGVTAMWFDALANTVTFILQIGTLQSGNLKVGSYSNHVNLVIDLTTGNWNTNTGLSGTISGAALTTFVNNMKTVRNQVETFATGASAIMPGSQVPW